MTVAIFGSIILAFFIANLTESIWPGVLLRGRDFSRVGILAAALITIAACLRPRHTLNVAQLLTELAVIQLVVAAAIWWFSAVISFDALFRSWWFGVNAFVGVPWIVTGLVRIAIFETGVARS